MEPETDFGITAAALFPNLKWPSGSTRVSSTSTQWAQPADPFQRPPSAPRAAQRWREVRSPGKAARGGAAGTWKDCQPQLTAAGKQRGKGVRESWH